MKIKNRKLTIIIAAGLFFVLLITAPLMMKAYRQKRDFDIAFQHYSASISQKDFPVAYSMATEEFKTATSYSQFVDIYQT